jgi:amidohydrolase
MGGSQGRGKTPGASKAVGKMRISGNEFLESAFDKLETLRAIRRDIHKHPELGMQEKRTAALIAEHLRNLEIEVQTGVAGTGVVGLLRGSKQGKTAALRADIDALAMQELNDCPYASENPGVAHTCGHDAHTAIQLGAAMLLSERRDSIAGNVKFIFQPSEDTLPGGALPMIEAGVLKKPGVDAIFSLHLYPQFEQGTVVVKSGAASTSSISFTLTIRGTGGHVGVPHKVLNPILLAALVMTNTQSLMPKNLAPGETLIFEFTSIHGGTVDNIVPPEVVLKGGIRVSSVKLLEQLTRRFETLIRGVVEAAGGSYTLEVQRGYPTIVNDPQLVSLWKEAAAKVVGEEQVIEHEKIMTTGDDAAYFQQRVPGVYWWLGIANAAEGFEQPLHSPHFDFAEELLAVGAAAQAQAVMDFLETE